MSDPDRINFDTSKYSIPATRSELFDAVMLLNRSVLGLVDAINEIRFKSADAKIGDAVSGVLRDVEKSTDAVVSLLTQDKPR